jgi:hypothetical protein
VSSIGLQREGPLHAGLKRWYAQPGDRVEVELDGYTIDLVRGDLLIEIQTGSFPKMKRKLAALLERGHAVRVVHPVATDRLLVSVGHDGTVTWQRLSPRHGIPADVFSELVTFPGLLAHPLFELEVLLTTQEEVRRREAGKCWRRRGWTIVERRLVDVVGRVAFSRPEDLTLLLPASLPDRFTTAELASALGRPKRVAQQMTYCLRTVGVIDVTGKRGQSVEYAARH